MTKPKANFQYYERSLLVTILWWVALIGSLLLMLIAGGDSNVFRQAMINIVCLVAGAVLYPKKVLGVLTTPIGSSLGKTIIFAVFTLAGIIVGQAAVIAVFSPELFASASVLTGLWFLAVAGISESFLLHWALQSTFSAIHPLIGIVAAVAGAVVLHTVRYGFFTAYLLMVAVSFLVLSAAYALTRNLDVPVIAHSIFNVFFG